MGDRWDEFHREWADESPRLKFFVTLILAFVVGTVVATLLHGLLK